MGAIVKLSASTAEANHDAAKRLETVAIRDNMIIGSSLRRQCV